MLTFYKSALKCQGKILISNVMRPMAVLLRINQWCLLKMHFLFVLSEFPGELHAL